MRNTSLSNAALIDEFFQDLSRVAIGFEPTFRRLHNVHTNTTSGYPPYDLEVLGEDHYRITLAVAGFTEEDLDVEVYNDQITITGEVKNKQEDRQWLYRGIASRSFTRSFHLADHVRIESATLNNGLLTIDLIREVPEALKPRKIAIGSSKVIEGKIV